jgi:hypothetical protein
VAPYCRDEEDVSSSKEDTRTHNTISHRGIAWSRVGEQIRVESRTSGDFRPHFASKHADSNLAMPFI